MVAAAGPCAVGAAHPAGLRPPLDGPLPDAQRREAAGEGPHRAGRQCARAGVLGEGRGRPARGWPVSGPLRRGEPERTDLHILATVSCLVRAVVEAKSKLAGIEISEDLDQPGLVPLIQSLTKSVRLLSWRRFILFTYWQYFVIDRVGVILLISSNDPFNALSPSPYTVVVPCAGAGKSSSPPCTSS